MKFHCSNVSVDLYDVLFIMLNIFWRYGRYVVSSVELVNLTQAKLYIIFTKRNAC